MSLLMRQEECCKHFPDKRVGTFIVPALFYLDGVLKGEVHMHKCIQKVRSLLYPHLVQGFNMCALYIRSIRGFFSFTSVLLYFKIHLLQANSVASLIASEKSFQQLLTASAKMRCLFEGVRITIVKAVERCRVRQRIAST